MTRAVRQINIAAGRPEDAAPRPFSEFADRANIVLLGDPGAGKTHLFREAAAVGQARFIKARAFPNTPADKLHGQTLFIDGLDEKRAGRGDRDTLDALVVKLFDVAPPKVRISCRAADWLGESDLAAMAPFFDQQDGALKLMINSVYGKLAEKKFRGIDPKTGEPIIPPHSCPWYASAITAHTRLELMKAALLEPSLVIQFATDAIYSEKPLELSRLKAETDIKAGKEDKLLGDWCGSAVPAAVYIQSGLAFYLDKDGKVVEAKSRGLPLKNVERAQAFLDKALEAWKQPYDPDAVASFKAKNIARHASADIKAFMPLASAIASPNKFDTLFCKWGEVSKTVWLDDGGGKRDVDECDFDYLADDVADTKPKENMSGDAFSAIRFPDWVENVTREENRRLAAANQFYRIEEAEIAAYGKYLESGDDAEFFSKTDVDRLLEENETIEI